MQASARGQEQRLMFLNPRRPILFSLHATLCRIRNELRPGLAEIQRPENPQGVPGLRREPRGRGPDDVNLVPMQRDDQAVGFGPHEHLRRPGGQERRHVEGGGFVHHIGEYPNAF